MALLVLDLSWVCYVVSVCTREPLLPLCYCLYFGALSPGAYLYNPFYKLL